MTRLKNFEKKVEEFFLEIWDLEFFLNRQELFQSCCRIVFTRTNFFQHGSHTHSLSQAFSSSATTHTLFSSFLSPMHAHSLSHSRSVSKTNPYSLFTLACSCTLFALFLIGGLWPLLACQHVSCNGIEAKIVREL